MANGETILYFGSFNPIHNGHTAVAQYVLEHGLCEELWFVVSPRNPLKPQNMLAGDLDRLRMTELAVNEQMKGMNVRVSDVEFGLPRPSYTIDTLRHLQRQFPEHTFSILTGADILPNIGKWKESEALTSQYKFYVYPRDGFTLDKTPSYAVYLNDAPLVNFSSTDVRTAVEAGQDISDMVADEVGNYIKENKLWINKNSR